MKRLSKHCLHSQVACGVAFLQCVSEFVVLCEKRRADVVLLLLSAFDSGQFNHLQRDEGREMRLLAHNKCI